MKSRFLTTFSVLIALIGLNQCSKVDVQYPENLKKLHENVWTNIMDEPADLSEVETLLADLKNDGSWADIDYTSKERGALATKKSYFKIAGNCKSLPNKRNQILS